MPEVAGDRHQALEERWNYGIWLGHARHTPEILIGTPSGVVKSWAIRRLPEGEQWDGDLVKNMIGSPENWKLDASEEQQLVELEDRDDPDLNPEIKERVGHRKGERRSMYLSRKDFETYGYSDGCVGCRDIASGKQRKGSFLAPHAAACRRRMEEAIKVAEPDRWERYILRRHQEEAAAERDNMPGSSSGVGQPRLENAPDVPQVGEEIDEEAQDLFRDLDEGSLEVLDVGVAGSPGAPAAPTSQEEAGACESPSSCGCVVRPLTAGSTHAGDSLTEVLCKVDMCEVFSPPRVGVEAKKFGLRPGDSMDITTGWDFNKEEDRQRAESYLDKEEPLVLIGSPPCVAFSQLQSLIPDSDRKR